MLYKSECACNEFVHALNATVLALSIAVGTLAQTVDQPYAYPVKPGTPQWKELDTHSQMIEACRIPEDVLTDLSTKALVVTCLHYPLFGDMFAFNDFQLGFDRVKANFNGLQELLHREDVGKEALKAYKEMDDLGSPQSTDSDERWRYMYAEMLLSQAEVLGKMGEGQRKELLRETLKKFEAKAARPQRYGPFNLTPSSLLMARLVRRKKKGKLPPAFLDQTTREGRFAAKPFTLNREAINSVAAAARAALDI